MSLIDRHTKLSLPTAKVVTAVILLLALFFVVLGYIYLPPFPGGRYT